MSNEIKKGDIVRVSEDAQEVFVYGLNPLWFTEECTVTDMLCYDVAVIKLGANYYMTTVLQIPTKYLIKVGGEDKPNVGKITIPVGVELDDSFYEAYTADLAKEIAVKVANRYNSPEETAEYAAKAAKQIVKHLKEK